MPPAITSTRSSPWLSAITLVMGCTVRPLSACFGASWMVDARPTIFGAAPQRAQSGCRTGQFEKVQRVGHGVGVQVGEAGESWGMRVHGPDGLRARPIRLFAIQEDFDTLDLSMINFRLLKHLYLFSVVAEELHFRRAAARLGMSQPPLTEQIQVLEAALKVKLFDRSGKGVQLTAEGAAILPAVKKLVFQMDRVEVAVQESLRGRGRMVTIGAITTAMASPLPAVIEQLKAEVPDASISVIEIDSAEVLVALDEGVIDVAFARIESGAGHAIHAHPLAHGAAGRRLAAVAPAGGA
jgi:DNA-binding MarR family transcriptional regulator